MRKEPFGKPTAILDRLLLEKRMRMMEVHSQWALVRSCAEPAATNAAHNNNSVVVPTAAPVEMSRATTMTSCCLPCPALEREWPQARAVRRPRA